MSQRSEVSHQTTANDGYLHMVQQEQLLDQLREQIKTLTENYKVAEQKNKDLVNNLQISRENEQNIIETHFSKQLENGKIFQEELFKDK